MRVADFSFELPESLIARYPQTQRSGCRLLSLDGPSGELTHGIFTDLLDKLGQKAAAHAAFTRAAKLAGNEAERGLMRERAARCGPAYRPPRGCRATGYRAAG